MSIRDLFQNIKKTCSLLNGSIAVQIPSVSICVYFEVVWGVCSGSLFFDTHLRVWGFELFDPFGLLST